MTAQVNETVFYQHHHRITKASDAAKTASSKLQEESKKAIEMGVNMPALKAALKIAKMDPIDQYAYLNDFITYMSYLRVRVGQELSPVEFDSKTPKKAADYYGEGFGTSALGHDRDKCPHDVNSDQGRSWMEGYDAHQRHLMGNIRQMKPKAATPEKVPREQLPPDAPEDKQPAPVAAAPAETPKRGRGRPKKDATPTPPADEKDPDAGEGEKGDDEGDGFEASAEELAGQTTRPNRDIPPPPPGAIPTVGRTVPGALN